jgi:hypothetical protein
LGGEKHRPRCLPYSMWYSDCSFSRRIAKGTVRDDWRKLVSSTYEMLSSWIGWCDTSSIALAYMRKSIGKAGEPCGRPQRKGLGSSICCKKVKASVRLVVNDQVDSQR